MDINLARTFLTVAETGSFIDAARKMCLTQSTVSSRIRSLEEQLDRELFERSKTGAALTSAGEQFRKHALALVRVWQAAQIEVSKTDAHRDRLSVAAPRSLWDGFLLNWISWLRHNIPDIAVEASSLDLALLTQRMLDGTLDMAITYRALQLPGLVSEHLFDEEFVLVTSVKAGQRRRASDYVFFDWGAEFELDHATAFPEHVNPGLSLDVGAIGLEYMLSTPASGYCPLRMAKKHISRRRLRMPARARKFVYPVYMVYPETRDEDAFEPILDALRRESAKVRRI
ncbi:MAG: LysR family transcriptional regulator [Alphaproteobacteria bacterium]|nr:LysR family transcriptional regulator [Alphaproteobacteria bacterium]